MEDFIIWMGGFFVGFFVGVIRGRRSIVREAQALVSETILEIRKGYKV
jgi:spore maturation protein SpmA